MKFNIIRILAWPAGFSPPTPTSPWCPTWTPQPSTRPWPESPTVRSLACRGMNLTSVISVSEQEIMELEKKFWGLVGNSSSGRIDLSIITPLVSPPLPSKLVSGLFKAFDENQDGHVDFKELACGVSAACRGPEMERQKCESAVCYTLYSHSHSLN